MDVTLPQFDSPFRLDGQGRAAVVEQDTIEEIGASIYNILVCPQGAKLNDPGFGLPSPLFAHLPLDTRAIARQIEALEPRAKVTVTQTRDTGGFDRLSPGPQPKQLGEPGAQLGRVVLLDPGVILVSDGRRSVQILITAQVPGGGLSA